MTKSFQVFLSHNSEDKAFVRQAAARLQADGISFWFDEKDLVPGRPCQEAMERALLECESCAVFIGPAGFGPWHRIEMRAALSQQISADADFRVIPVLLPGALRPADREVPAFLRELTWVQFHDEPAQDHDNYRRLVCGIRDEAPGFVPPPVAAAVADDRSLKIVPHGLRSFSAADAKVFLRLLPGPRDERGLPASISFWKNTLEQIDADRTFRVGLIYGPSGCGKSSLVKAGLIPRLAEFVAPVYVEAVPQSTELLLLRELRKAVPGLPADLDLLQSLERIREQPDVLCGRKVVLIVDQFEQWLHANPVPADQPLVQALRACDGGRLQCVLMVRDEFFLALNRLMAAVGVSIREGVNMALVDLFDLDHAQQALAEFGRAFGKLPDDPQQMTDPQRTFLAQVVQGLAEDHKIVSVHLALFAEMVKGRPWTPATLAEVGGAAGVGEAFLEESFDKRTANPVHRVHRTAAMAVLKSLLPEAGTQIRERRRTEAQLREVSEYAARETDFGELLRILNEDLRLVTPVETDGDDEGPERGANLQVRPDGTGVPSYEMHGGQRYYQLTHDYLVPSLRQWLTRRQRETRRGRAELKLQERTSQWKRTRERRYLPSPVEYLNIVLFGPRKLTDDERALVRASHRFYGGWGSGILAVLMILAVNGWWLWDTTQEQRAKTLVENLQTTAPVLVGASIENLRPFRDRAMLPLRNVVKSTQGEPQHRLHAACALADFGDVRIELLLDHIVRGEGGECRNIVRSLRPARDEAVRKIAERLKQAKDPGERVRLGTVALHMGAIGPVAEWLKLNKDPSNRTEFIHNYHKWRGDPADIAMFLRQNKGNAELSDFRSGLCAALGYVGLETEGEDERRQLLAVLRELYETDSDGGTHSAAASIMTKWGLPPSSESPTTSGTPVDDRGWFVNQLGMTMIKIPAGMFQMGDDDSESDEERPRHSVTLTASSFVCDREVTVNVFRDFLADATFPADQKPKDWPNRLDSSDAGTDCAVTNVSWYDAVLFCNWLSFRTGLAPCYKKATGTEDEETSWDCDFHARGYRLPTEAEWEYACRAMAETDFACGDDPSLLTEYAWFYPNAKLGAQPAGAKLPNGFGLFDMHGSLWEWCWDVYGAYPAGPVVDPGYDQPSSAAGASRASHGVSWLNTLIRSLADSSSESSRVLRGGSWLDWAIGCRSAFRVRGDPGACGPVLGFRVWLPWVRLPTSRPPID